MKNNKLLRILCLSGVILVSLFLMNSCGSAEEAPETDGKTPYEETIPASFSENAGVGRDSSVVPEKIEQQEANGRTVCIDPGHGFFDGGCGEGYYSDGTLEKDINMAIALKLEERLSLLGYDTIVTHDGKNLPPQDTNQNKIFSATERVVYANSLDIDYLISIHVNALDSDPTVGGMHIYYQQSGVKKNTWGATVVGYIADAIHDELGTEKKPLIKDGTDPNTSFALTRDVTAASSLLEVGFITNEEDAANMVDPDWQQSVANAIADGIDRFFTELDDGKIKG